MVTIRQAAEELLTAGEDGRLEALCRTHGVALLVLFGSAVPDPDRVTSDSDPADLDIAVLPRSPSQLDRVACHTALVDLVHVDRIDLLDLSSAGWLARSQALGGGIPLYEDQPGTYAAAQFRAVPLAMELGWLTDLELSLLADR